MKSVIINKNTRVHCRCIIEKKKENNDARDHLWNNEQ